MSFLSVNTFVQQQNYSDSYRYSYRYSLRYRYIYIYSYSHRYNYNYSCRYPQSGSFCSPSGLAYSGMQMWRVSQVDSTHHTHIDLSHTHTSYTHTIDTHTLLSHTHSFHTHSFFTHTLSPGVKNVSMQLVTRPSPRLPPFAM